MMMMMLAISAEVWLFGYYLPHRRWWEVIFSPASVDITLYVNNFLAPIQVRLSPNSVSHTLRHSGRGD